MAFDGTGWANCGALSVALSTTTIATFPSGTTDISGTFYPPSTLGPYTLAATGTSTSSNCQVNATFDIVAVPSLLLSPTEPDRDRPSISPSRGYYVGAVTVSLATSLGTITPISTSAPAAWPRHPTREPTV